MEKQKKTKLTAQERKNKKAIEAFCWLRDQDWLRKELIGKTRKPS